MTLMTVQLHCVKKNAEPAMMQQQKTKVAQLLDDRILKSKLNCRASDEDEGHSKVTLNTL